MAEHETIGELVAERDHLIAYINSFFGELHVAIGLPCEGLSSEAIVEVIKVLKTWAYKRDRKQCNEEIRRVLVEERDHDKKVCAEYAKRHQSKN